MEFYGLLFFTTDYYFLLLEKNVVNLVNAFWTAFLNYIFKLSAACIL